MSDSPTSSVSPKEAARLMKLATYASTSVAALLITTKLIAWLWTDSVSLLAALLDSCLDVAASLVTLLAVRHSLMPADDDHRFGHGKAESLAALAQSMLIIGSVIFLILEASSRFLHPQHIDSEGAGIGVAVMILSIIATLALITFQRHVVKKSHSSAIAADAMHYKTDLYMNVGVIAALLLTAFGWQGFDPMFAIGIGIFILYSTGEIIQQAMGELMDQELTEEEREPIRDIVAQHSRALGMHDLRTRKSGTTLFIQMHLELDDDLPLIEAHHIADEIEASLLNLYPNAEIIIHQDPIGTVHTSEK